MLVVIRLASMVVSDPDDEVNLFEAVESDLRASSWELKRERAKVVTLKSMQHAKARARRKFILSYLLLIT